MTRLGAMLMRDLPPEDVPGLAAAVAPGFDELWVIEDLNWAGGISQLTAVLDATDTDAAGRPAVGHGIAPAPFRNAAALAMEWATLERLHPGRLRPGVGHGVPIWMQQIGEGVESPLTLLRETIEATRRILDGGVVSYNGRYVDVNDVVLMYPPAERPPIYAGVTKPRGLRLSGEVADGTILAEGFGPDELRAARATIDEGRAAAGRTDPHDLVAFTGFYWGDPSVLPPPPPDVPDGWAAVSPDLDEVVGELQAVIDAGVDSVALIPFGPFEEQLDRFIEEIKPRLDLG